MSSSAQDILDFAQDNDVKFVRLAFCDIFGVQKNLAIMPLTTASALTAARSTAF